jgi:hypothetical protein
LRFLHFAHFPQTQLGARPPPNVFLAAARSRPSLEKYSLTGFLFAIKPILQQQQPQTNSTDWYAFQIEYCHYCIVSVDWIHGTDTR